MLSITAYHVGKGRKEPVNFHKKKCGLKIGSHWHKAKKSPIIYEVPDGEKQRMKAELTAQNVPVLVVRVCVSV